MPTGPMLGVRTSRRPPGPWSTGPGPARAGDGARPSAAGRPRRTTRCPASRAWSRAARSSPTVRAHTAWTSGGAQGGGQAGPVPRGDVLVDGVRALDGALDGVPVVVEQEHDRVRCAGVERPELLRGELRRAVADHEHGTAVGARERGAERGRQREADRRPDRLAEQVGLGRQREVERAVEGGAGLGDEGGARGDPALQPAPEPGVVERLVVVARHVVAGRARARPGPPAGTPPPRRARARTCSESSRRTRGYTARPIRAWSTASSTAASRS